MNDTPELGHNNPPEPTPYETAKARIDELMVEAKNWLDGSKVTTQPEADAVSKLLTDIRAAEKAADEARAAENEPFDKGKTEVQARYNVLIGKTTKITGLTVMISDACKAALAPYLKKLEDEKRAVAEAARKEAEEKARMAQEAMRAADALDIVARSEAEAMLQAADDADKTARRAENDKAKGFGGGRAVTLRSVWTAKLTDRNVAIRHFWKNYPEGFDALLQTMGDQAVRSGAREIPGYEITEERVPV